MTDSTFRNLDNLRASASTARVLNLLRVSHEHGRTDGWRAAPLFQNPTLNRSLIIKHRLRRNEIDEFRVRRYVATKIILPSTVRTCEPAAAICSWIRSGSTGCWNSRSASGRRIRTAGSCR